MHRRDGAQLRESPSKSESLPANEPQSGASRIVTVDKISEAGLLRTNGRTHTVASVETLGKQVFEPNAARAGGV